MLPVIAATTGTIGTALFGTLRPAAPRADRVNRRDVERQEPAMSERSEVEQIRAQAAMVVELGRRQLGVPLGYDESGVRWLDGYIERLRNTPGFPNHDRLIAVFGAYLGECIIRCYGGSWDLVDDNWAVRFDEKNGVFPFTKVAKHIANGKEDSVLGFFTFLPKVYKASIRPS
jgi:hypothetical protein